LRQNAPKVAAFVTFVLGIAGVGTAAAAAGTASEKRGTLIGMGMKWIDNKIITNKDSGTVILAAVAKAGSGFFVAGVVPAAAGYYWLNR
jgi:hypothetical protein